MTGDGKSDIISYNPDTMDVMWYSSENNYVYVGGMGLLAIGSPRAQFL
jgi:hypothetical protein